MIGPRTFLAYAHYRYLKLALVVTSAAIAAYAIDDPTQVPGGDTSLGYTLGAVSAALVVWLLFYGVRRRRYRAGGAPLQAWLSAHVYLGTSLLVLVPLHSGFQFGWNVHTLAYALLCLTATTGVGAVVCFAWVPSRITANRPGDRLEELFEQIAEIDADCRLEVAGLPDAYARAISTSIEQTRIGGGLHRQFARDDPQCGTRRAIEMVRAERFELDPEARDHVRHLLELLSGKQKLVSRVRRDVRYKAILEVWMLLHVPLSVMTTVAVAMHVIIVFYYW